MAFRQYSFRAKVWRYKENSGWYFVTLPKALSTKIRAKHGLSEEGWGRLKTVAKVGKQEWQTAVWYDKRAGSYLLPLKAAVRKKAKLNVEDRILVVLKIPAEDRKIARLLGGRHEIV